MLAKDIYNMHKNRIQRIADETRNYIAGTIPQEKILDITKVIDNGGKNCIFQFYISKDKNNPGVTPWVSKSINSFIKYANKHGVDYFFLPYPFTKELNNWHYQLWFEKIRIYKDTMFDKYDKVLYVDTDVIVKNIENNIFDIDVIDVAGHPERYSEALYPNPYWNDLFEDAHRKVRTHFGGHCGKAKTVDRFRMINTGVLIWTKQARLKAREKFIDPQLWIDEIFKHKLNHPQIEIGDQSCFNTMFELHNFDVVELGFEWNRYPTIDDNYPCNFAHYTSGSRHRLIMYN